ncbi:hypothetical protein R8Z50_21675 [Longispora sp. K20-0274]|uniref:hypothetical protein n=1 Tax=Longispora sp. K20-0274 TaxID=3088255 RepID=UPI00399B1F67
MTTFLRYQSPEPDAKGRHVGVFGLVNTLARQGRLTADQEHFRRTHNAWYDAAYTDPTTVDPTVYDEAVNPGAAAWFRATATHLFGPIDGYLAILAAHDVPCVRLESDDPGRVVYEDAHQIVVVPTAVRSEGAP